MLRIISLLVLLNSMAQIMTEINRTITFDETLLTDVQRMDGYKVPTIS